MKNTLFLRYFIIICLVFLGGIGYLIYSKIAKQNEFKTTNNPQKAKEVSQTLKEIVGKIYVLPEEDPKIATVVDTSVLPKDPFYKSAQNGDKILIFPNAQKIILYRPSINKVVDVGIATPNQNPNQGVAGVKTIEIKPTGVATDSSTIKTQPKILFKSQ